MKAIKMFGLAALLALLAMAFVGATSAMAERTALCGTDTTEFCQATTHVHETSVGNAVLATSLGTTECTALFLGDVESAGSPLTISGKFTYSSCKLGSTSCTATEENGPSTIEVLKEGHETSKVTGKGLVHLVCGSLIDCSYTGTGLKGTGKGPLLSTQTNGEVTLSKQSTTKEAGGFLCPKTAELTITTTPLEKTYINAGLHYCVQYKHEVEPIGRYANGECTVRQAASHWDLVVGPEGLAVGEKVCVDLLNREGLYERAVLGSGVCQGDDETRTSLYEQGEITKVQ